MILLSFDIEEFDTPFEYGVKIPFNEQMNISVKGTERILSVLRTHNVKATFFCTATFALHSPETVERMVAEGHEVASHGYEHGSFHVADLKKSKTVLEELTGAPVNGYRMARMMPVDNAEIVHAGYRYNSSLNPTFLPGRYSNLAEPRTWFFQESLLQIPASVTPLLRIPLFWLSFHNFPFCLYRWLAFRTLRKDGYLNIYFHPWEFAELREMKHLKLPFIITNQSGELLISKLERLICLLKKKGELFGTFSAFAANLS